jgi:hypothetical protein
MATLKDIANTCLAVAKVKPDTIDYNARLVEAVQLFLSGYAKRIRDDSNKGRPTEAYEFEYTANLYFNDQRKILRTVNKVYAPIRTNTYAPFPFVGSDDGRVTLMYIKKSTFWSFKYSYFLSSITGYTYENGYIYILNNNKLSSIQIISSFELPHLVELGNEEIKKLEIGDELMCEFPCPLDMMNSIIAEVASLLISQPISNGQASN